MGNNSFGPYLKQYGCFIVLNISPIRKTLQIFQNPILYGCTRDLLAIRGVGESEIRISLLKGELNTKIRAGEIRVVCSDVDLLQFNKNQKQFLMSAGITNGLEITAAIGTLTYAKREDIFLIGTKNSSNRIFYTPERFINGLYDGNKFHISVTHNGRGIFEGVDYNVLESGGPGTGYDSIEIISFLPSASSDLRCTYTVRV